MRFIFLGTILFLIKIGFAQFKDDFSDGNFTHNPAWTGDSSKFTVQNGSLNLHAVPQTDTAYLSTPSNVSISAEWSFYVGLDFNPSSSNYCRIFLMCNSSNPHKSDKAYFVKIGGSQDEVSLYRLDGKNEVKIIDGNDGQLNLNQVALRVKITRDSAYNWILLTDSTGNHNYTNEGSVLDSTYTNAQYFALSCRYSSTRSDKFHFDDFEASGKSFVDQEKPKIIDDHILSYENWFVQFSEKLDTNSFNASNFIISDQALPKKITYDSIKTSVLISVKNSFIHGKSYSLHVSGVRDRSGNQMKNMVLQQVYNDKDSTQFKDIVISEFMSDPSPVIFLPESEYIELHN